MQTKQCMLFAPDPFQSSMSAAHPQNVQHRGKLSVIVRAPYEVKSKLRCWTVSTFPQCVNISFLQNYKIRKLSAGRLGDPPGGSEIRREARRSAGRLGDPPGGSEIRRETRRSAGTWRTGRTGRTGLAADLEAGGVQQQQQQQQQQQY